ncbi:MAG: 23S rRNA (guanosine(2251)-2'-O)-methyltransferase RlmB [Wenzhouxiangellaceae bacterium]
MKRERACGINAVDALLTHQPERVIQLWSAGSGPRIQGLLEKAARHAISIQQAQPAALDRLAEGETHQGIVAEFRAAEPLQEGDLDEIVERAGGDALLLLLDQVQDPHNLGACMRSAAAAGAHAVVVPRDRAAGMTPAVRRAAAGAAEIVALVEVANLARTIQQLQKSGVWCIGLAGEADTSLYSTDLTGPLALVLGGEEHGLRQLTRKRCDGLARIPMRGGTESLNVSVATGVALFEATRQRSER